MKHDEEPAVVSLEQHRRKRLAEKRKAPARPRPPQEGAINWRRVPLFVGAVILFLVAAWLIRQGGGLLNPFH